MGSVAIVTGSDSGIGKATAVALAEAGFGVGVTWHTDRAGAEGTVEEVGQAGRKAAIAQLDLTALPAAVGAVDTLAEARHADQGDGAGARSARHPGQRGGAG